MILNIDDFYNNIKNGKSNAFETSVICHNMKMLLTDREWEKSVGIVHYEDMVACGITKEQLFLYLYKNVDKKLIYYVENENQLDDLLETMIEMGEIFSPSLIRIAVKTESQHAVMLPAKYCWIKDIEIEGFTEAEQNKMIRWLIRNDSIINVHVDLFSSFSDKLMQYHTFHDNMIWEKWPIDGNLFVGMFMRSILLSKELYHSVMLTYDYMEFMLSLIHYYYKVKAGEVMEKKREIYDVKKHGVEILRLSKGARRGSTLRDEVVDISKPALGLHDKLEKYYSIRVKGLEQLEAEKLFPDYCYNFLGMIDVLQRVRNRTRGHGVIVGKSGYVLWDTLYFYCIMMMHFLDVAHFALEIRGDKVYAGYDDEELICLSPFVIGENDVPLIWHQTKGKQKVEYINYFYGEYTIPEF